MIRVERDPDFINSIANSDDVRPFIRPDGEAMDFTPMASARANEIGGFILSNGEDAIAVCEATTPDVFQVHTMFAKTCRGRKAINTAREMLTWMFDHGAQIVWGCTPRRHRAACMFNRLVGGREIGGDIEDAIFEYRRPAQ